MTNLHRDMTMPNSYSSEFDSCSSVKNEVYSMDCCGSMIAHKEPTTGCIETNTSKTNFSLARDYIMQFDPILFRHGALEMSDEALNVVKIRLTELVQELENIQTSRRSIASSAIIATSAHEKKRQQDNDIFSDMEEPPRKKLAQGRLPPQPKQEHHIVPCLTSSSSSSNVAVIDSNSVATATVTVTASTTIPTEILRLLLRSSFLPSTDLGRLLLLTSRSIMNDMGKEYVYHHLCRSSWRNSRHLPLSLTKARGQQWLFSNLSKGLVEPKNFVWQPLPPPRLTPEKMTLLMNMWNGKREVVSEVFQAKELKELFRTGRVIKDLSEPIVMGQFTNENNLIRRIPAELDDWSAKMHLFRLDTNQCCCVHESRDVWWYFDGDLRKRVGNLHLSADLAGLELTPTGKKLEFRIREHDREQNQQSFEGIYFETTMVCDTYQCPNDPSKMEVTFTKMKMELYSIYEFAGDVFRSESESKIHGVTALHLLDELRGWEMV